MSKRKKVKSSKTARKRGSIPWWTPLIIIVVVLLVVAIGSLISQPATPGTVSGVFVETPNGEKMAGTYFIAEVGSEKYMCGIEHVLSNPVVEIGDGVIIRGEFEPVGAEDVPERILCAPVETEWPAFEFHSGLLDPGEELSVASPFGRVGVSFRMYDYSEGDLGSGQAMYFSGVQSIQPSWSGAPVTLGLTNEVVGVVAGGTGSDIIGIPYSLP